ncbi:hypothetical protein Tco_1377137 [Tanacetum coccineum]
MKATPRKLAYVDSDKEAPAGSLARGFSYRFFLKSSGTSDTRNQTRFVSKSQRTPSKNKELTHLKRSRRLEDGSITKEKARKERSKPKGKWFGRQETSSDSEREEGSEDTCKDLNSPYKRPKSTPFTQRITRFKYHRRVKLPRNIKFRGAKLEVLRRIFITKEFKSESSHIKGVPPILRISAFMHGHVHPELAKKLNDKIPKTMDEMFERVMAFIRGEVAAGSAEMVCPSQRDKGRNTSSPGSNRSSSNYGKSRKKTGMRSLEAVSSTIHSMIKFSTNQGIVTMETSRESLWECRQLERVQDSRKEVQWRQREEQMCRIKEQVILKTKSSSRRGPNSGLVLLEKTWDKEDTEEVRIISHKNPDRHVTMGTTLKADCK